MNKSVLELVKSHCSILYTNIEDVKFDRYVNGELKTEKGIFQLDFLTWYPSIDRISEYGVPGFNSNTGIKDNPNWIPTEHENVYMLTEYRGENVMIDYQLCLPGKSPVKILNWWYFKVREGDSYNYKWRVSLYGKALRLYYLGFLPRLLDYVIKYNGECSRADLCWDFPCEIPNGVIDLPITGTNHSTTYFGEKNSPLFFRIYDKTQDLRREKNCFAWFYPDWYQKECWRVEAQLTGHYSRSMSPLDRLDIQKVDKSVIKKQEKIDRSVYKTALYSVINTVDWLTMSNQEKLDILMNSKKLLDMKIKKLRNSIY